jgi:hypothetical protein
MEAGGRENLVNRRNLLWDEENRLLGVSDNGVVGSLRFAQCALQWSREVVCGVVAKKAVKKTEQREALKNLIFEEGTQ